MLAYQVLIIGAGAGGSAAAWAYTQSGMRVLLLEAGPRFDPDVDYHLDRNDWELHPFPSKPGSRGEVEVAQLQMLAAEHDDLRSWNVREGRLVKGEHREPGGPDRMGYVHVRGVGGSTLAFTGEAQRLHPKAMQMKTRFGVAEDWPFSYQELEPYYVKAEEIVGVSGMDDEQFSQRPRSQPYPQPPHPRGRGSQWVIQKSHDLGLNWVNNPRAALSQPEGMRPPCNYCGNCGHGCSRRDKGSTDQTFLAKALATGLLDIQTGVEVTRLESVDGKFITRVLGKQGGRACHWPTAGVRVVLAAGAIQTPRLLLGSASSHHPRGLANRSGQVGKNLMETLFWSSTGLGPLGLRSHEGLPADVICWDFNDPELMKNKIGIPGGCRFTVDTQETGFTGPVNYALRVVPGWGKDHKVEMRKRFGTAISVSAIGESLPNANSYLELGKHAAGQLPPVIIHAAWGNGELDRLRFMATICRNILTTAGIPSLVEEYSAYDFFAATHVVGTARMGADPNTSVVDLNMRTHDVDNLYITDASCFPSSGGGESPSLTVQAVTLKSIQGRL
jgi:choline dehydrogenase-like flavoprotein